MSTAAHTGPADARAPCSVANTGIIHGSVHITVNTAHYVVEPFPDDPLPLDATSHAGPSRLLAADHQVIVFTGRGHELARLSEWRDDPTPARKTLLLHGPGGQGKTRLAAEFARDSALARWRVVRARPSSTAGAPAQVATTPPAGTDDPPGLLIVVDYAERWPTSHLLALLRDRQLNLGVPARVLLLSRASGDWWQALRHELGRAGSTVDAVALGPLADTPDERRHLFHTAVDAFAAVRHLSEVDAVEPPDLGAEEWGTALSLHMAALAAVEAAADGTGAPVGQVAVSAYLLDRERAHWQALYDSRKVQAGVGMLGRVVYVAILTGRLPSAAGVTVLHRAAITSTTEGAHQLLDDHRVCYPPRLAGTVLEPLYPDRLAEDFLALSTPGHPYEPAHRSHPWALDAIATLLGGGTLGEDLPGWAATAVATLVETARRWPHMRHAHLYPLLRAHPELALTGGGNALLRLTALPDLDLDLLEGVEPLLPRGRHIELDLAAAAITERLTERRLARTTDPAARARLLAGLSDRLANAGRHAEAVTAMASSVELRRSLAEAGPAGFDGALADALTDLGVILASAGRHDESLPVAEEALEIYRKLAAAAPHSYDEKLAIALHNLGRALSDCDRQREALARSEQALEIFRRLAAADPVRFAAKLANALHNVGLHLVGVQREAAALDPASEAVEAYRRLATTEPAIYEPDLANALFSLAVVASALGRWHEALAAIEESTALYRRLAEINAVAFEPELARALRNLGRALSKVGRRQDALTAAEEAVAVCRRLAADPVRFTAALGDALDSLGGRLSAGGHHERALAAAEECVALYRRLRGADSAASERGLAAALTNLAPLLATLHRWEDALRATQEAAEIYRGLQETDPDAFLPERAMSLANLAAGYSDLDEDAHAMEAGEQAVELYGRLVELNPGAYLSALSRALHNLGHSFAALGRYDEAMAAASKSVEIRRGLAADNSAAFVPDLAHALEGLASHASHAGDAQVALRLTHEALEIRRRLAASDPEAFEVALARSLRGFARVRDAASMELDAAMLAAHEAMTRYEELARRQPDLFSVEVSRSREIFVSVAAELEGHGQLESLLRRLAPG